MSRWSALAALLALVAGLALRHPRLDLRPIHNDEAVNAVKVCELWEHGRYAYDPDEYHGPLLHYATLPFLALSGAGNSAELRDSTLRLAPVAFGLGLILLLPLFAGGLSAPALAWCALFLAVSPAMVFYSRYFIHEMPLIFCNALTLGAGWKYAQTKSAKWALGVGAGVGLMFATKETFVITLAALGCAAVATSWKTSAKGASLRGLLGFASPRHLALALGAIVLVWLLFFSSFFTNFAGLADSIRTYLPWLKRAGGHSPHIHPWYFYFERLAWFHPAKSPVWSEGLILALAVIGLFVSFRPRQSPLLFFLAVYTLALTAAYTVISYKTPWCLLNFHQGFILLAGVGAAALVDFFRSRPARVAVALALLALTAQLAWQAWRAAVTFAADRRNPYVYAQTLPDLLNLVRKAEGVAAVAPTGFDTVVKVITPQSDYWPLPWSLRRFKNIGWYEKLPEDPYAPIIIAASKLDARLDEKSDRKWVMAGLSELRPKVFLELYVELELWKKYVATLPRDRD